MSKIEKILQDIKTKVLIEEAKQILEKAKKRYDDDEDSGDEGDLDLGPGMRTFDPDQEEQDDAASEWLKEHEPKGEQDESTDAETESDADEPVRQKASSSTGSEKGKTSQKVNDNLDPEKLAHMKELSGHWLNHADQVKRLTADAKKNPHLFAEGHRVAAHNAAHEDFNTAHRKLTESEDFKKLSPARRMQAELQFKKDFHKKNPEHHMNAQKGIGEAHKMHSTAKDHANQEKQARIAHIMSGGQGAAPDETMSAQEAAQHVGGGKDDEGYVSSTVQDPAASFANRNKEFISSKAGEKREYVPENDTVLENPNAKAMKHPKLEEPANKKAINDFVTEYHPLIQKAAYAARKKASSMGIPEDKIDLGDLHMAGMHGLMQAVKDYSPDVGASFKTHASNKMMGLMQSHIAGLDYIPKELRSQAKSFDQQPKQSEAVSAPAPQAPSKVHEVISSSNHPAATDMGDRLKRVAANRNVIVRKKPTGVNNGN